MESFVPEDWLTGPLKDFMPLQRGFDLPTSEVVPGSVPVVYSNGIGRLHNVWMVKGPGVVTGRSGTIGAVHFVERDYWPHNTALWVTRFDRSEPRFTYHYLQHLGLDRFASGSGVPTLNRNDAHSFVISIPRDRSERDTIAQALSEADDLVESLERLIVKKQAIKHGMMQQLLTGRTRLPSFAGQWEVLSLGSVAKMGSGGTPPSSVERYYGGGIPWVSISDMTRAGKYLERTVTTLSAEGLSASAARLYEPNVVLYAMYASLGECSIAVGRVCSSQAILGIDAGPRLDREFLYYHLLSIKPRVKLLGQQGTQSNLNAGMVRIFELRLPPIDEQRAISAALADADIELRALERRLESTRLIKQGMMQELLTGRTRLVPAEVGA